MDDDHKALHHEVSQYLLWLNGAIVDYRRVAKFNRYDIGYETALIMARDMAEDMRMIVDRINDESEDE